MSEAANKIQPVVGTNLTTDEFEDLHVLATLRGETLSAVVTELIRKELKFRQPLIDQAKATAPKLLEAMQSVRYRKGRNRIPKNQKALEALNGISNMMVLAGGENGSTKKKR